MLTTAIISLFCLTRYATFIPYSLAIRVFLEWVHWVAAWLHIIFAVIQSGRGHQVHLIVTDVPGSQFGEKKGETNRM